MLLTQNSTDSKMNRLTLHRECDSTHRTMTNTNETPQLNTESIHNPENIKTIFELRGHPGQQLRCHCCRQSYQLLTVLPYKMFFMSTVQEQAMR
jgi:hypothetical protein